MSTDEVQASRLEIARNFAVAHHLYVVLKGHRTLIATPDEKVFINPTGNPGMATGGTGDVLTGMIAAWLAQLLDAEAACKLAVYLHGMAGDLAEADEGEVVTDRQRSRRAHRRRDPGAHRASSRRQSDIRSVRLQADVERLNANAALSLARRRRARARACAGVGHQWHAVLVWRCAERPAD